MLRYVLTIETTHAAIYTLRPRFGFCSFVAGVHAPSLSLSLCSLVSIPSRPTPDPSSLQSVMEQKSRIIKEPTYQSREQRDLWGTHDVSSVSDYVPVGDASASLKHAEFSTRVLQ
jgi:hypothetical protein